MKTQNIYKEKNIVNNTLSPRYLFGHAGFYILNFLKRLSYE
jgi:hypothetical protein